MQYSQLPGVRVAVAKQPLRILGGDTRSNIVDAVVADLLGSILPDRQVESICLSSALELEVHLQQAPCELLAIVANNVVPHPDITAASRIDANLRFSFRLAQIHALPLILFAPRSVIDVEQITGPAGVRWTALSLPFSLRDLESAVRRLGLMAPVNTNRDDHRSGNQVFMRAARVKAPK
jgi:hypothetical protein